MMKRNITHCDDFSSFTVACLFPSSLSPEILEGLLGSGLHCKICKCHNLFLGTLLRIICLCFCVEYSWWSYGLSNPS